MNESARIPWLAVAALAAVLLVALAQPALAHDCSSPRDCEQTAGYNAVVALAGGVLALTAGLFGNAIAGGGGAPTEAGAEPGTDGATGAPRRRRGCCLGWFTMILSLPVAAIALVLRAFGLF